MLTHFDTLMTSYQTRIEPDDLETHGPGTGPLAPATSAEVIPVAADLSKDMEQRLIDLEARAKAGEKFFAGRQGKFGEVRGGLYRGQLERTINATMSRLGDALRKPADSLRNQANRFVQQAIGSAKSNAKQTGAMIQKTRGMTERLLETAARMRR